MMTYQKLVDSTKINMKDRLEQKTQKFSEPQKENFLYFLKQSERDEKVVTIQQTWLEQIINVRKSMAKQILVVSLVFMWLIIPVQSLYGCSTGETSHQVNLAGTTVTSCDGSCETGFNKVRTLSYEHPIGNLIDIYNCFECICDTSITYYSEYTAPSPNRIHWYSCPSTCSSLQFNCLPYQFKTLVVDAVGDQQAIFRCKACPLNCLQCSSPTVCTTCHTSNSYFLGPNGTCQDCQQLFGSNCQDCNSDRCLTCRSLFYLDYSTDSRSCVSCSTLANCTRCSHGPICDSCASPTVFNLSIFNKNCTLCGSNCDTCQNGPICSQCNPNTYLNFSDGNYQIMQQTYLVQHVVVIVRLVLMVQNVQLVSRIFSETFQQIIQPVCLVLQSPIAQNVSMALNAQNVTTLTFSTLLLKINHVFLVNPQLTVKYAHTGRFAMFVFLVFTQSFQHVYFFINKVNTSCVPCTFANCFSCLDGPVCSQCLLNHIIDPTFTVCTSCPSRQYEENNFCHPCVKNCVSCQVSGSNVICHSCDVDFVLHANSLSCFDCQQVTQQCIACSDMLTCTLCKYPYNLGVTGKCDQCIKGFDYLDGLCVKPSGCVSFYSNYSKCLACASNHHFVYSQANHSCVCESGYKLTLIGPAKVCLVQCGNGITSLADEDCDDGNTRNNDGCSQQCEQESGFICTPSSPSQCYLDIKFQSFEYNYAYKVEGQNRGQFSFSLSPSHPSFQYINWSKYLTLNITSSFIVPQTLYSTYFPESNEIIVELDYVESLEDLTVEAFLTFIETTSVQKSFSQFQNSHPTQPLPKKISFELMSTAPKLMASSSKLSLVINLQGKNMALIFQTQTIREAGKAASNISLAVNIIIMTQFLLGAFFHKMIGLETIQVLQFAFFARITVQVESILMISAFNPLKYAAYGGYTNYEIIFGSESKQIELSNVEVTEQFLSVGMSRYFALNVNFALIWTTLSLIMCGILLSMKFNKRNNLMEKDEQSDKDTFTVAKRRSQRVYDNAVFPFVNLLNMASLFCAILHLQSKQSFERSDIIIKIRKISFIVHITILFVTFVIFTFQALTSYDDFKKWRLTEEERARIPQTKLQKLEHDQNYIYRPNYKPGYVLIYLSYFFALELIIIFYVMIQEFRQFGILIMVIISLAYLIFIWVWQPYCIQTNFHNKVLRFNHFVIFIFAVICELHNRFELTAVVSMCLVYFALFCMILVGILGYMRIYVESQFRQKLSYDPTVGFGYNSDQVDIKNIQKNQRDMQLGARRNKILMNNKFSYQNQLKQLQLKQQKINPVPSNFMTENTLKQIKNQIRRQLENHNFLADYFHIPVQMSKKKVNQQNSMRNEGFVGISESLVEKVRLKKDKESFRGRKQDKRSY